MAVVLSPSLLFRDLRRQQLQATGYHLQPSLHTEPWSQRKPAQQYDLSSTDVDLGLESLCSTYWYPLLDFQLCPPPSLPSIPIELYDFFPEQDDRGRAVDSQSDHEGDSMIVSAVEELAEEAVPYAEPCQVECEKVTEVQASSLNKTSYREAFDDVLFSSLWSDTAGTLHKLGSLCSLCRHPFESKEENALIKYVFCCILRESGGWANYIRNN